MVMQAANIITLYEVSNIWHVPLLLKVGDVLHNLHELMLNSVICAFVVSFSFSEQPGVYVQPSYISQWASHFFVVIGPEGTWSSLERAKPSGVCLTDLMTFIAATQVYCGFWTFFFCFCFFFLFLFFCEVYFLITFLHFYGLVFFVLCGSVCSEPGLDEWISRAQLHDMLHDPVGPKNYPCH